MSGYDGKGPDPPFGDYSGEPTPEDETIARFALRVYEHYGEYGRSFPWRETRDPYAILVSEVMLQQTQTSRVLPKYRRFLSEWPDFRSLAGAELSDVYPVWQGLGYNRRARGLIDASRIIVNGYGGVLPEDPKALQALPSIGAATAGAICAYAFGLPVPFIETNIRRTFIHFFFETRAQVKDGEIMPLVERTMDRSDPRQWFYALTDYGVFLKDVMPNANRRSAAYVRQSPFSGSDRQIRGRILRVLSAEGPQEIRSLVEQVVFDEDRVAGCLGSLVEDGMVAEEKGVYRLP